MYTGTEQGCWRLDSVTFCVKLAVDGTSTKRGCQGFFLDDGGGGGRRRGYTYVDFMGNIAPPGSLQPLKQSVSFNFFSVSIPKWGRAAPHGRHFFLSSVNFESPSGGRCA